MLNHVAKNVYTVHNGDMSASSVYRVYPHPDFEAQKPQNYEIKDARHNNATKAMFEREVKRIIRKEVRQFLRMAGMGQIIHNEEANRCKQIFWFLATLTCLLVSSYFVGVQIIDYFKQNTVLRNHLAQSELIKVPAISLCPGSSALINSNTKKTLFENCAVMNISEENCENTSFGLINTNISDIWQVIELSSQSIIVSSQCPISDLRSTVSSCIVPTERVSFDSFWGKCLVVSPKEKEQFYHGPHSYYNVTIANENQYNQYELINIYLHNAESMQNHIAYFKSLALKKKEYISISIQPTEFKMLSKELKNCTDSQNDLNCQEKCWDEKLAERVKCRLPFMQSNKHPFCDNYRDALRALQAADIFYRNATKLTCEKCGERCRRIEYLMGINNVGPTNNNSTQLLFYYQDNTLETIIQTLDYPFNKVLSEVGGILGFFLGFSVLGALELIQQFIYCLKKKFWKKRSRC
uniref:Uncharacterized protein n=1 Tax=Strigamia maritima TaxID=126957 RepID=T1J926_STRMM